MTTENPDAGPKMGTKSARAGGLKPAETVRNAFALEVPPETTQADLERPTFWMHDAAKVRPFDRIEVRWQDGEKWAEVLVTSVGTGFARIHVLSFMDRASKVPVDEAQASLAAGAATASSEDDGLVHCYVKFRGPTCRWSVLRKSDDLVITEKLGDKVDALIAARQYDKTVSA